MQSEESSLHSQNISGSYPESVESKFVE